MDIVGILDSGEINFIAGEDSISCLKRYNGFEPLSKFTKQTLARFANERLPRVRTGCTFSVLSNL